MAAKLPPGTRLPERRGSVGFDVFDADRPENSTARLVEEGRLDSTLESVYIINIRALANKCGVSGGVAEKPLRTNSKVTFVSKSGTHFSRYLVELLFC